MRRWMRHLLRYGVAVVASVLAMAGLTIPVLGKGLGNFLYLAVLVSVWFGGLGPGLFATGLLVVFALAAVIGNNGFLSLDQAIGIFSFAGGGIVVTLLVETLHSLRRRAEASRRWLEAVLTSIGDAVIATDGRGHVTFTNPVARSLTGWEDAEAVGKNLEDIFQIVSETTREPIENPVARVLREGMVIGLGNHTTLIARDGSECPIDDSAAPIRIGHEPISGVVLVFRDVTERRRAEAAAREAERRKDAFLAMLAHELRNPLAAIKSALTLSQRTDSQEQLDWARDVTERQVGHLSRMVDDLLDVSRFNQGKIHLRRELIDVASILRCAEQAALPLIRERNHCLSVSCEPASLLIEADPTRLEQILVNLLTNAAKYSEAGGRIWLSAGLEGEEVVFRLRDTGVGISEDLLENMFDLFVQGDRSLARSEGGLGIGLTLVQALSRLHGGTITASSAGVGKGSEFMVRLPAWKPTMIPVESVQTPGLIPEVEVSPRNLRILVVDDNVDTARGLARLLKHIGHAVEVAHDGPSAIEIARTLLPDSVLLDIGLPGMDGYKVAEQLRSEACGKDAVVIAVSGYGQDEDRRRSMAAGCNHHMTKPVDFDDLVKLLPGA
jgi:PAS domain S-box-containing protein